MEVNRLGIIFIVFLAVVIGLAFLDPISDSIVDSAISSKTINNESITLTVGKGRVANTHTLTFTGCRNASMVVLSGIACNVSLGYGTGYVSVNTENISNNLAYIDYTYQPVNYVGGTSSTLMNLIILFCVLGIIGIAILLAKPLWEEKF